LHTHSHEPHPWAEMTPEEALDAVLHELYAPLSALGTQVDRLSTGAFADEELGELLEQIRGRVDDLGRVVVTLKRYRDEWKGRES
jgi:K+-sensing histidine kinase KdpD